MGMYGYLRQNNWYMLECILCEYKGIEWDGRYFVSWEWYLFILNYNEVKGQSESVAPVD